MDIDYLVKELQSLQAKGHGSVKVVLAEDEEGNGFKHLGAIGEIRAMEGKYYVESLWDEAGENYLEGVPEDNPDSYLAIVLWP